MKFWDLKMREVHALMSFGVDHDRKTGIYLSLIDSHTSDATKLNLQVGVQHGNGKYGHNWISLDPFDQRPVIDVREKLEHTTLKSDKFDLIVCNAILEHVEDPFGCVKQMHRICKPGGKVWVEIPFVQPYHPSKDWEVEFGMFGKKPNMIDDEDHGGDYWRFTPMGLVLLMKPFKMKDIFLVNDGGIAFYGEK